MPPADVEDTWSDSDDELEADHETSVDLGVPDGPVEDAAVLLDAAVSRIGGHPVRCTFASPCTFRILITNSIAPRYAPPSTRCRPSYLPPIRLLRMQHATSARNRWSCSSRSGARLKRAQTIVYSTCGLAPTDHVSGRKAGTSRSAQSTRFPEADRHRSVRAWRELRFNKKYAEKLERKLARRKAKELEEAKAAATEAAKKAQPKSNPFAVRRPRLRLRHDIS